MGRPRTPWIPCPARQPAARLARLSAAVPALLPVTLLAFALAFAIALPGCARWFGSGGQDPRADAAAPTADASPLPEGDGGQDATLPCGATVPLAQGDLPTLPDDPAQAVDLPACGVAEHLAAVSAGQALAVVVSGATQGLAITVTDDHGALVGEATVPAPGGEVALPASAVDQTGGLRVVVTPADPTAPTHYAAGIRCDQGCDQEATRYPMVLVHGAGGAATFGSLEYFWGVEDALTALGYVVFAPTVSPWAHSADRALELRDALEQIRADTGATKVHLLGHSQAGLDFRVLLGGLGYGDHVASATSVSTPHRGLHPSFAGASAYYGMDVTEAYLTGEFATLYPEVPEVPRFSWAGATCGALEVSCLDQWAGEIVAAGLASTYLSLRSLYGNDGEGGDNDGVVPVSTAAWGEFLGILAADHWDLVGQIPLQRLGTFDTLGFYVGEARRLRALEIERGL